MVDTPWAPGSTATGSSVASSSHTEPRAPSTPRVRRYETRSFWDEFGPQRHDLWCHREQRSMAIWTSKILVMGIQLMGMWALFFEEAQWQNGGYHGYIIMGKSGYVMLRPHATLLEGPEWPNCSVPVGYNLCRYDDGDGDAAAAGGGGDAAGPNLPGLLGSLSASFSLLSMMCRYVCHCIWVGHLTL